MFEKATSDTLRIFKVAPGGKLRGGSKVIFYYVRYWAGGSANNYLFFKTARGVWEGIIFVALCAITRVFLFPGVKNVKIKKQLDEWQKHEACAFFLCGKKAVNNPECGKLPGLACAPAFHRKMCLWRIGTAHN